MIFKMLKALFMVSVFFTCLGLIAKCVKAEEVTVPIRWVRINEFPQSEVRDGACVIYAPARVHKNAPDDVPLEPLVRACLTKGGLVPGSGDMEVRWQRVDQATMDRISPDEVDVRDINQIMRPMKRGAAAFFEKTGAKSCRIVQLETDNRSLAHELLHCYVGFWH